MSESAAVVSTAHIGRCGVTNKTKVPTVECWLCGSEVEIRFSKKDKPYLVCGCGVQTFIRYQEAEDLLAERVEMEQSHGKS